MNIKVTRRAIALLATLALVATILPIAHTLGAFPETSARDKLIMELGPLQAQLRADHPAAFGGLWLDASGQPNIAVVAGDAAAVALVERASLTTAPTIEIVANSEDYLNTLHDEVRAAAGSAFALDGVSLSTIETDIIHNTVTINAINASTEQLAAISARFGPGLTARSVSGATAPVACNIMNCPNPLKGGLTRFHASMSDCQSTFVMRGGTSTYYLLTAGHCAALGETKQHPAGVGIGAVVFTTGGAPKSNVDGALIGITKANASNFMYNNGGTWRSITSRENPSNEVIGETVCSSRLSGQTCGVLLSVNVTTCCGTNQRKADGQFAKDGDSGSPVYRSNMAMGVLSANDANNASLGYYTHIRNVEIKWNVQTQIAAP